MATSDFLMSYDIEHYVINNVMNSWLHYFSETKNVKKASIITVLFFIEIMFTLKSIKSY